MELAIIIATVILVFLGSTVAVWSIFDTRKKYYQDYLARKRGTDD